MPGVFCMNDKLDKREWVEQLKEKCRMLPAARVVLFVLAVCMVVVGGTAVLPGTITVSTSVDGRQLPIYCVDTEKKQVALTFDAAWGNG